MRTAVLTFTYPGVEIYFNDLLTSLNQQLDKDFDFLIVNDQANIKELFAKQITEKKGGEVLCKVLFSPNRFDVKIKQVNGTIARNRKAGLAWAKEEGYEALILTDSDDYMAGDRIKTSKTLLAENKVVFNEIVFFDTEGLIQPKFMFADRLKNGEIIGEDFIRDKNCLGMSNTAIAVSVYDEELLNKIPDFKLVFDWSFFTLVLQAGNKAVYTNDTATFYRRNDRNRGYLNPAIKNSMWWEGLKKCPF
jgi:glycosyltransferase involved in cell wall biosynthesis